MDIHIEPVDQPDVRALLEGHLADMRETSPPESVHALDISGLQQPDITFWVARRHGTLLGCAALKSLSGEHAEIKSMRTAEHARGQGVASALLENLIDHASKRGIKRLSLETGSMAFFAPARAMYAKYGFSPCGPFSHYKLDPNSVFMTRVLTGKDGE
ncbi:GNAT family N-acetyltransferase [Aestuariibacter halophilus]|uniref:GNAT family N-acetyltransferase n=1 Tax=Fluctibacter halophilus TaxID=226011 RepID=A0ABS8G625_9ALTE|nr:GNAT family N-acetyltransferase [Aestuariibacter halophilus]MCC2616047.1 GNAT family N-acetyltransferase [Aestuariibacter halophilus]